MVNAKRLKLNAKHGFTLIELLVVIVILGILFTIALASFSSAQGKTRDAKRKGDLDAVKKSLELYKSDSSGGYYPACTGQSTATGSCAITTAGADGNFILASGITYVPTYIQKLPQDPSHRTPASCAAGSNNEQAYCYRTSNCASVGIPARQQCTSYTLSACLENKNDQSGNTSDATTECPTSTRIYSFPNP